MNKFSDFRFPQALNESLAEMGYKVPTPVQAQAIPLVLAGKDLLVTAQTGTGKTAAFSIPLLSRILRGPNLTSMRPVLIVAPTRELAEQTGQVLEQLGSHAHHVKTAVIIGGTSYPAQIRALRSKPFFVVGTPGRLLDQIELGHLDLSGFGTLVIDEADRLLDMGFEPQVKQLVQKMPSDRQSLLFSATLPDEIIRLASQFLRDPERVKIGETSRPVEKIKQKVIQTSGSKKDETLIREIDKVAGSIIVFTRTKSRTEKVAKVLDEAGHDVVRLHGDRTQSQRTAALEAFRDGTARILVATDIAARGIDVPHIQHVVNYDLPVSPEDYIHRIGRTARNGADGHSIAFVTPEEMELWARIFKLIHGHFPEGFKRAAGKQTHLGKGGVGRKSGRPADGGHRSSERHDGAKRGTGGGGAGRGDISRQTKRDGRGAGSKAGALPPNREERRRAVARSGGFKSSQGEESSGANRQPPSEFRTAAVRLSDAGPRTGRTDRFPTGGSPFSRDSDGRRSNARNSNARNSDARNSDARNSDARNSDGRGSEGRGQRPRSESGPGSAPRKSSPSSGGGFSSSARSKAGRRPGAGSAPRRSDDRRSNHGRSR